MKKKKKSIVFRSSGKGEDNSKHNTNMGGGRPVEEHQEDIETIIFDILNKLEVMPEKRLEEFFSGHLGVVGIRTLPPAIAHINAHAVTVKKAKFMLDELNDYLNKDQNSGNKEEKKKQKEEVEEPEEQEVPETPEDFQPPETPNPENMETMEDVKLLAIQFLSRLDVVEKKVTTIEEDVDSHNEQLELIREAVDEAKKDILIEVQGLIEKMPSGGGGNTYTVRHEGANIPDKKLEGIVPVVFETVLKLVSSRVNVFMYGPTGSGKTTLARLVAEALGLRFCALSCSEGMDESVFNGAILPIGEGGKFTYVPSTFIDFYENGGVFLIDEICAADANLLITPNAAIGNNHFYLPLRWECPLVKRHKDFICIASDNTMGTGGDSVYLRNQLDGSTLDRFKAGMIKVDYDDVVEKAIVQPDILTWGKLARKGITDLKLNKSVSTRILSDLSKLKAHHNWSLKDVIARYFVDWEADDIKRFEAWKAEELKRISSQLNALNK